jgi:hypothetical protein
MIALKVNLHLSCLKYPLLYPKGDPLGHIGLVPVLHIILNNFVFNEIIFNILSVRALIFILGCSIVYFRATEIFISTMYF